MRSFSHPGNTPAPLGLALNSVELYLHLGDKQMTQSSRPRRPSRTASWRRRPPRPRAQSIKERAEPQRPGGATRLVLVPPSAHPWRAGRLTWGCGAASGPPDLFETISALPPQPHVFLDFAGRKLYGNQVSILRYRTSGANWRGRRASVFAGTASPLFHPHPFPRTQL